MSIPALGSFPNTIANLPDRPDLSAQRMKEALQADIATAWPFIQQLIQEVNTLTSQPAVHVGSEAPATMAASLSAGDVYVYVPDLPENE